jgi:magnesium chelatase subunit I
VLNVFNRSFGAPELEPVVAAFKDGFAVQVSDTMSSAEYVKQVGQAPALRAAAQRLGATDPAGIAAAVEFVLEGLHLSKKLNKDVHAGRSRYRT